MMGILILLAVLGVIGLIVSLGLHLGPTGNLTPADKTFLKVVPLAAAMTLIALFTGLTVAREQVQREAVQAGVGTFTPRENSLGIVMMEFKYKTPEQQAITEAPSETR